MPRIKDQAICIREIDWSETSQIVTLLTQMRGKLRGVAKGSRRTSRSAVICFSGGIDPLTMGQVLATAKPAAELATITEWDLQKPWRHFRTSLDAHHLGFYAVDLAGALLADLDPHPGAFAALSDVLEALADPLAEQRRAALLVYQWRLLADCGYKPEIELDVATNQPLEKQDAYWFDPSGGGLSATQPTTPMTSSPRALADTGPWRVRGETVDALRAAASASSASLVPADPQLGKSVNRANRLLCAYVRTVLDRQLPTMRYILSRHGE